MSCLSRMMALMDHEYLPVANTIADWLRQEGHAALVEPTNDRGVHTVAFRTRGHAFALVAYEHDPAFCHVKLGYGLRLYGA